MQEDHYGMNYIAKILLKIPLRGGDRQRFQFIEL